MGSRRFLILIIVTIAVIVAAVLMRNLRDQAGEQAEGAYFPDLLEQSNDIMKVVLKNAQQTTIIENDDGVWVIAEKGNYPASLDKVRALVLGMARLQRVEGKTSKPELYGRLGLDGIDMPDSASTLIQLVDGSENTLALLIVGKEKVIQGGAPRRQFYVRSPDDPQAWLVEGQLPELGDLTTWMNTSLFGSDAFEIRSVKVVGVGGSLTISRENAESEVYELEGLATDENSESQFAINQIARSFADLKFEDVRPTAVEGEDPRGDTVVAELFDGSRITLLVLKDEDQYFGQLSADSMPVEDATEAVVVKVKAWNELWRNREYLLPDYQLENIIVAREDLIKQDASEAAVQ